MVGKRGALNQVQKIPEIQILGVIVIQPHTWYTCPAGRKAIIEGTCVCQNAGAAATLDLNFAGTSHYEWQAVGGRTDENIPQDLALSVLVHFKVELAAGETMQTSQNTGTNGNFLLNAFVRETAV